MFYCNFLQQKKKKLKQALKDHSINSPKQYSTQ